MLNLRCDMLYIVHFLVTTLIQKLFFIHRLERQKTELEKEVMVKMRSEPDGKRVSHNNINYIYIYIYCHGYIQDDTDGENGPVGKSCMLNHYNCTCYPFILKILTYLCQL